MRYLIPIILLLVATNTFAGGRINPFNGKPLTYSLSDSVARDSMGAAAYTRMRVQQWQHRSQRNAPALYQRTFHKLTGGDADAVAEGWEERASGTVTGEYRWPVAWLNGAPQNMHIMQQDNSESTFNGGEGDGVKQGVTKAANEVGDWVSSW